MNGRGDVDGCHVLACSIRSKPGILGPTRTAISSYAVVDWFVLDLGTNPPDCSVDRRSSSPFPAIFREIVQSK